ANYSQPDYELNGINYEQAKAITLAIAEFHARWWDDTNLSTCSALRPPTDTVSEFEIDFFRTSWEMCSAREDFRQYLPEGGFEVSKLLYEKYHLLKDNNPEDKLTIVHSDFRADNVFIDDNNEEQPVIVFDWALAIVWRGVADISFLLGTSVDTDLRRNIEKDLIQQYYNRLIECGVKRYSFDECWTDYLKGYLYFTTNPLAIFALGDRSSARGKKRSVQPVGRWFSAIIDNDAISLLPK
ncbi:MAG: phosphotransferase, partial [Dehalococcoidia bacterium]